MKRKVKSKSVNRCELFLAPLCGLHVNLLMNKAIIGIFSGIAEEENSCEHIYMVLEKDELDSRLHNELTSLESFVSKTERISGSKLYEILIFEALQDFGTDYSILREGKFSKISEKALSKICYANPYADYIKDIVNRTEGCIKRLAKDLNLSTDFIISENIELESADYSFDECVIIK